MVTKIFTYGKSNPKTMAEEFFKMEGGWMTGTPVVDTEGNLQANTATNGLIKTDEILKFRNEKLLPCFLTYTSIFSETGLSDKQAEKDSLRELIRGHIGFIASQVHTMKYNNGTETLAKDTEDAIGKAPNLENLSITPLLKMGNAMYAGLMKLKAADRDKLGVSTRMKELKDATAKYVVADQEYNSILKENNGSIKAAKLAYCEMQDLYLMKIETVYLESGRKTEKSLVNAIVKYLANMDNKVQASKKTKREEKAKKAEEEAKKKNGGE